MNKPSVKIVSAIDAVKYALNHLDRYRLNDTYAAISIQDTGRFGFELTETEYCKGVLTLFFDDIEWPCDGYELMTDEQAMQIIDFIDKHRDVDTLLIHCYAGASRSRAVGVFAREYLGLPPVADETLFNNHVYYCLKRVAESMKNDK